MSATVFKLSDSDRKGPVALVVEPRLHDLLSVLAGVSGLGFDVSVAETFKDAKAALRTARPALLVVDVKLHEYNGLHLVLWGRRLWGDVPAVVTAGADDPVLQSEAEQLGATFVALPTPAAELTAAICRTALRQAGGAHPIRPPFERRQGDRRRAAAHRGHPERRTHERRRSLQEALGAV